MELGTGCSYAAKKDCAQLECGNAFSAEYAQNRLCICIRLPNTAEKTHTV